MPAATCEDDDMMIAFQTQWNATAAIVAIVARHADEVVGHGARSAPDQAVNRSVASVWVRVPCAPNVSGMTFWIRPAPSVLMAIAPPPRVSEELLKLIVPPPKKAPLNVAAPPPGEAM